MKRRAVLFGILAAITVTTATALKMEQDKPRAANAETESPTRFEPANGTRYLGVSTNGTGAALEGFLAAVGRPSVAIYNRWSQPMGSFDWILRELATKKNVTPMISWNLPGRGSQASIAEGSVDAYLRARIGELKAFGRPVFLRVNWEFNGCYYPWSAFDCSGTAHPGNLPRDYVAAWRHVAKLVADLPNVTLVWAPTLFAPLPAGHGLSIWDYYPGNAYVGWIGMDAYPGSASWDVMQHADQGMDNLYAFASAHHKPVMLSEWGLNDRSTGDNPQWVHQEMNWVVAHPQSKAAIYFDYDTRTTGGQNYRLASLPAAAAALKTILKSPSWLTTLGRNPYGGTPRGAVALTRNGPRGNRWPRLSPGQIVRASSVNASATRRWTRASTPSS